MTGFVAVFVYGSLLKGEANHHLLRGAEYLGPGRTPPAYRLLDLGAYPGLVADGTIAVAGEVYRVAASLLGTLDALEEHPTVYVRTAIRLEGGRDVWTYLLREDGPPDRPAVPAGDWRAYRKQRDGT
jgi:gamma-glutamylaminecyclotransferase